MDEFIERLRAVKWEVIDEGDRMPDDPTHKCVFVDMRPDDFRALLREAAAALEAARGMVDGCHCATCTCTPGMTPAIRFDTSPAAQEGAVRDHLIALGWTPPGAQKNAQGEWVLVPKKPTLEMSRAVLEEMRFCDPVGIYQKMLAAAPPSAPHPAITHCDNCGCDWLDNGLNPIGCPYCKQPAAEGANVTAALQAEVEALRAEVDALRGVLGRILENEASDYKVAEEFGGYVLDDELREEARAALAKENSND